MQRTKADLATPALLADLDASEIRDAIDALAHYIERYQPELRALAL